MTPRLSLVLVAHRSSAVLPAALTAFRREAAACGCAAEIVIVEQSEDSAEAERAAASFPDVLLVRPNRGYAAGINAGLVAARGELLLVGNPDVELEPGALAPLLAALTEGWDVVGPQFGLAGTLFPPADEQTPGAEWARRRAAGSRGRWRRHVRAELARWRAVWDSPGPVAVPALSGALLAFPAALAARLGPWDERYFLYFEETDWLRRARRAGGRLAVVPAARAVHRWGHAAHPERFADRFAASQRRFYRRHYPLLGRWAVRVVPPPAPPATSFADAPRGPEWTWLLSPSPLGFPAARVEPGRGAAVDEVAAAFCRACERPGVTLVAVAQEGARMEGPYAWSVPSPGMAPGAAAAVAARAP